MCDGEFYLGLQPELGFAIGTQNVYVSPWFFTRKEKKAIRPFTKHGRTHTLDNITLSHPRQTAPTDE